MSTENAKQKEPSVSIPTPHVTQDVSKVCSRFDALRGAVDSAVEVFQYPHVDILFAKIKDLTPNEVSSISLHIRNVCKHTDPSVSRNQIDMWITKALAPTEDVWFGRNEIREINGEIVIVKSPKSMIKVSNFILIPQYIINVDKGYRYHVYNVKIKNQKHLSKIVLRSEDFNKLDSLQSEISQQLMGTSANINGCAQYMKDIFHMYVNLANFQHQKEGTSLIGLERFSDDGDKYFCTPTGIYDMTGHVSEDILYMGNREANQEEVNNLTNLKYKKDDWIKTCKTFLGNAVKLNDKVQMMLLLGWMGAIPHDYVIRKEAGTGFFPHCHIIGEPGAGKSTLMTLIKQFMGHNDSTPRTFPTPFETSKLLNSSYTIPAVLDEYGKRWRPDHLDAMNKVLVEAFTKSRWSRGQSNLGSVYFKYKNPILMGGQVPTSDQALATRIIPVSLTKFFQRSSKGPEAMQSLKTLQKLKDKNFWVGYNLWCAQFSNEDVESIYIMFRDQARALITENRVADIYAVVLLGLYYLKQLAEELNIDIGYTEDEICDILHKVQSNVEEISDSDPLKDFLKDLGNYAITIGNSKLHGEYFGEKRNIMLYQPKNDNCGRYGNTTKYEACIYGKECVAIKIDAATDLINNWNRSKTPYSAKEIEVFINTEFQRSMDSPTSDDNVVLAPRQYKMKYGGMYTLFNKQKLIDMYPEFEILTQLK